MFRSQRVRRVFLAGTLVVSILAGAGCKKSTESKKAKSKSESSDQVVASLASDSSEEKVSSSEKTETTDPVSNKSSGEEECKQDALKLAQELGVKEDDLRGRYELFIKYVDCLDQNTELGTLKDYVLHLFPVVADHLKPGDENHFFQNLSELKAEIGESYSPSFGEFHIDENLIIINDKGNTEESSAAYNVMYHELMHFIDYSIGGSYRSYVYYTGARFAHGEELTDEEWLDCKPVETNFIVEGGADFYTGKYYRKNMEGYNTPSSFLSGIEWIYGEETVDRIFFASDSTMEFIRLLQDAGISDQKIVDSISTFNHETYSEKPLPDHPVRFEDLLVDLYESKKGSTWKDDKVFMQILNEINAWTSEEYPFEHEELKSLLLDYPSMEQKTEEILNRIDRHTSQDPTRIFKLMLIDGKPYLAADLFTSLEFDRNEAISLIIEYDFDKEQVISYEYFVPDYPEWII